MITAVENKSGSTLAVGRSGPGLCFDAVVWVIWPVRNVPKMAYNVLSGTLSLLTHSG